jgi:hypothetical protein
MEQSGTNEEPRAMITLQCDACNKTFEVDSREAGGRVECPHCGDVNRVPLERADEARRESPASSRGMTDSGAPAGEKEIVTVRPAMFRAHPFKYMLIVLVFAGGITLTVMGLMSVVGSWLAIPGGIVALIALVWWLIWWINTHMWIKAVVTNKRTIRHEGIIRRHTTEVLHDHVRSVNIDQNFIQRLLNVGYVGIDSAGQDEIEIEIRDIPAPYKVKEIIDRYRKM